MARQLYHDPGMLRHKVSVQAPVYVADAYGQEVPSFVTVSNGTVRAFVEPLSAIEASANGTIEAAITHRVIIRHSSDVSAIGPGYRIVFGTRNLEVVTVLNIVERNQWLECQCKEAV